MRILVVPLLVASCACFAWTEASGQDFKREAGSLQGAINEIAERNLGSLGLLSRARATHLDRYGMVVTLEVALERTSNPFMSPTPTDALRRIVMQRLHAVRDQLRDLLKSRAADLGTLPSEESLTIIVYIFNTNPADLPDLPGQMIISVKKQDVLDLRAGKIQDVDLNNRIVVKEH